MICLRHNNIVKLLNLNTLLPPTRSIKLKALIPQNYPVPYERVPKTPCWTPQKSGDLGLKIEVSPNDYILDCQGSKELEHADENVKKMFSLNFNPKRETTKLMSDILTKQIQRHKYDVTSPEVRIGIMTLRINLLQELLHENPYNKGNKMRAKELIEKRNKHLKILRNIDYKLYEWLLEKLNLFYRLPLEDPFEQVTKKGSLRFRTDELCQQMIQEKLDTYRAELDQAKKVFFKEKLDQLINICEQEKLLGLTSTDTEEEINRAKEDVQKYCEN